MKKILTIRARASGETLIQLQWQDEQTTILKCKPTLEKSTTDWINYGLHEWIGHGMEAEPRTTLASASDFLENLRDHLASQFPFDYLLEESS